MPLVALQFLLAAAAGVLLYLLWRAVQRLDPVAGTIVALGLGGRLVAGELLFWISWLDVIPRKLHFGKGIWFFAPDGVYYLDTGSLLAKLGLRAIYQHLWSTQTPTYLDLLSLNFYLFGSVLSVALLMNAFFYTASGWVIARWSASSPGTLTTGRFAIAAISFYPAGVLWSLQSLKDPMLWFLVVAFAGAAAWWHRQWTEGRGARGILGAAVALVVAHYLISGSRWFLGLVLLSASALFLLLVVRAAHPRRLRAALASLLLFALLCGGFLLGAARFIPPGLWGLFRPASGTAVTGAAAEVETLREGFAADANASTQIRLRPDARPAERWLAGLIAAVVPRVVIGQFDSLHIGGGRGFFWFADADTLYFDAVLLASLVLLWRRRSMALLFDGVFWLVALTTLGVAGPTFYVVTNFGTLFRFRGMILAVIVLLPLAAASAARRTSAAPAENRQNV